VTPAKPKKSAGRKIARATKKAPLPRRKTASSGERLKTREAQDKILQALRRVITHLPSSAFAPDASLVKDLGIDSLKVAELSIALEDAFDRPVFLAEVFARVEDPSTLTVAQLAGFVARGDI
jgi:acyl carrier protein